MTLVQYNKYVVSNVDADGLVLEPRDISSHSADLCTHAFWALCGY